MDARKISFFKSWKEEKMVKKTRETHRTLSSQISLQFDEFFEKFWFRANLRFSFIRNLLRHPVFEKSGFEIRKGCNTIWKLIQTMERGYWNRCSLFASYSWVIVRTSNMCQKNLVSSGSRDDLVYKRIS